MLKHCLDLDFSWLNIYISCSFLLKLKIQKLIIYITERYIGKLIKLIRSKIF